MRRADPAANWQFGMMGQAPALIGPITATSSPVLTTKADFAAPFPHVRFTRKADIILAPQGRRKWNAP